MSNIKFAMNSYCGHDKEARPLSDSGGYKESGVYTVLTLWRTSFLFVAGYILWIISTSGLGIPCVRGPEYVVRYGCSIQGQLDEENNRGDWSC